MIWTGRWANPNPNRNPTPSPSPNPNLQVVMRDELDKQVGKLSLVDLAGSERAADSSSKDRQVRCLTQT